MYLCRKKVRNSTVP
jgi:hypothetical protein